MERFTLRRNGARDVTFTGDLLASVNDRIKYGQDQTRWNELQLYRTEAGSYVLNRINRTLWQGEHDEFSVDVFNEPEEITEFLEEDGYLPNIAKDLLDAANGDFSGLMLEEIA